MTLPHDTARCHGRISSSTLPGPVAVTTNVGQAECVRCLRRTAGPAPEPAQTAWMAPPTFSAGRCPQRIAP